MGVHSVNGEEWVEGRSGFGGDGVGVGGRYNSVMLLVPFKDSRDSRHL